MNILIIGGTGLISTSITREFLERGDSVTLYNRGQTEVRIPNGARFIQGDRNNFTAFEQHMQDAGMFDCVIDMICFTPEQAESDVRAFKERAGHMIFCSTVDVYSKPAHHYPLLENEPRKGNNSYGSNKILCEDIFFAAHERGDFPSTTIRPAYTYGEGAGILHSFGWGTHYLDRIRKGLPIIVHGDGSSLWVVCHVDDAGHTFVHASGNPTTFGKAYHVTGEEWLTWNRYHECVAEAMNAPAPKLVHISTEFLAKIAPRQAALCVENFQGNNIFDNTAAKTDLDFHYTIPWVTGARRAINWLEQRGRIKDNSSNSFDDRVIAAWERMGTALQTELSDLA